MISRQARGSELQPNMLDAWEKQRIPALYGPLSGGSAELEVFTRKVGLNAAMPD